MNRLSVLAGGLVVGVSILSSHAAGQSTPASPSAPSAVPAVETPIPESVFNVPATPRQGRNPFFPNSSAALPAVKTNSTVVADTTALVLNGITSPPKRMAMINGRSFEPGEVGDVKLPNGMRIRIECIEILDDRVIIKANGQQRELQLRAK